MGTAQKYLLSLAVLAIASTTLGCGSANPRVTENTLPQSAAGDAGQLEQLSPGSHNGDFMGTAIGGLGEETSPTRVTSDETFEIYGAGFVAESADSANYIPLLAPQSFAVVPGVGQDISWVRFGLADLTEDRPVLLNVNVSEARADGGGEVLPLYFFVGVANFTRFSWDWWGPFTDDSQVSLNHAADEFVSGLSERYVSETGVLKVMVATGPATGGGGCAVQVDNIVVTTSPAYTYNKPHYVWFVDAHAGSSLPKGGKKVTALEPEQFINLSWNHVEPFGALDYLNAPTSYQISRQAPADGEPQIVGQAAFPGTAFSDPLDRDAGVPEPVPGTTYRYLIQAQNNAGATIPATTSITVPILPPDSVSASMDGEDSGFTLVSWSEVEGAVAFEIWRGISPLATLSQQAGTAPEEALPYEDETAIPGTKYWYFIRSVGIGDGDEANGIEAGGVSGFSIGSQGMRRVELVIAGIEPAASGSGTQVDPFVLASSIDYQFKAFDQVGREITLLCIWETIPGIAGTFNGINAGLLESIQPAPNEFMAQATYNFSTFSWVGSAYCTAE